ncbi:MAG: alpha-galactosidase, partial [Gemmatimonadales bacterium]
MFLWPYGRAAVWPSDPATTRPHAPGRLRFDLDERRRWSLTWVGEGRTVPLIEHAVLGVAIGDDVVTLADLSEVVTGTREPPGGDAIVIRGRGGGVYLETEFVSGPWAEVPRGTVSVSVYPDRHLPVVRGVRFLELPTTQVLPGAGPLLALASPASSSEAMRVARAPNDSDGADLTSHGEGALARGARSLGLAFDARSAGLGELRLAAGGLAAVSDWRPGRPVRPEGETCALHLATAPDADALAVLGAVFAPDSPVDADRLAAITAPAGWASRYALADRPTEEDILANLERCATHFDRRHFRFITLGPGYQRALGDWDTNERFPRGHRWLTEQVHARGFRAGLWLAPFVVSARSGVADAHPDWLLRGPGGPLARSARPLGNGRAYALDGAHPAVQEWLYAVARRAVREWGYDLLDADHLDWAIGGVSHHGAATHADAYRRGLAAIRDGLGTEAFLLAGRAPLQHAAPYVNGLRVGGDGEAGRGGAQAAA